MITCIHVLIKGSRLLTHLCDIYYYIEGGGGKGFWEYGVRGEQGAGGGSKPRK